jgi:hypothetical protein
MNDLSDATVMVFDDDAARGSAIPTPSEGMVTYLKDTNLVQAFNGSAFASLGTILQVVSTTKTDASSISIPANSFSGAVSGLTATITPSSTSSKVLVLLTVSGSRADDLPIIAGSLRRNTTPVGVATSAGSRLATSFAGFIVSSNTAGSILSQSFQFLDSPNSTSALTYDIILANNAGGTTTYFVNRSSNDGDNAGIFRAASSITLMEVAG